MEDEKFTLYALKEIMKYEWDDLTEEAKKELEELFEAQRVKANGGK